MDIFNARSARAMLAGREGPAFDDPDYIFELKLDGDRCLAYLDGEETILVSKRARYITRYLPELGHIHKQVNARCILDGELIIGSGRKHEFERLRSRLAATGRLKREREARAFPATFLAFDILYHDGRETLALPLLERKSVLRDTVHEGPRLALSRFIPERGRDFFTLVSEQGLEGVMAKKADSTYRMGRRSKEWVKCKNWDRDAFVVCGYMPSEKANVASLILGQFKDGALAYAGHVVLGWGTEAFGQVSGLPSVPAPLVLPPEESGNLERIVWVEPKLVCQVGFVCRTSGGGIRQPVFQGLLPCLEPEEALWPEVFSCVVPHEDA